MQTLYMICLVVSLLSLASLAPVAVLGSLLNVPWLPYAYIAWMTAMLLFTRFAVIPRLPPEFVRRFRQVKPKRTTRT